MFTVLGIYSKPDNGIQSRSLRYPEKMARIVNEIFYSDNKVKRTLTGRISKYPKRVYRGHDLRLKKIKTKIYNRTNYLMTRHLQIIKLYINGLNRNRSYKNILLQISHNFSIIASYLSSSYLSVHIFKEYICRYASFCK